MIDDACKIQNVVNGPGASGRACMHATTKTAEDLVPAVSSCQKNRGPKKFTRFRLGSESPTKLFVIIHYLRTLFHLSAGEKQQSWV